MGNGAQRHNPKGGGQNGIQSQPEIIVQILDIAWHILAKDMRQMLHQLMGMLRQRLGRQQQQTLEQTYGQAWLRLHILQGARQQLRLEIVRSLMIQVHGCGQIMLLQPIVDHAQVWIVGDDQPQQRMEEGEIIIVILMRLLQQILQWQAAKEVVCILLLFASAQGTLVHQSGILVQHQIVDHQQLRGQRTSHLHLIELFIGHRRLQLLGEEGER